MSNAAVRKRFEKRFGDPLRAGESFIAYAQDLAGCKCAPVGDVAGVPTIPVGRTRATDRCLLCGTAWRRRNWVGDELEVLDVPGSQEVA